MTDPAPAAVPAAAPSFAAAVVRWQRRHGRRDLPWQQDPTPYRVWLSEIMLQQTQVAAVIPYYRRFLRRFPSVSALARARQDSVLAVWSGLGYYARARNLREAARRIAKNGLPETAEGWLALPGVGKSTAAAIMIFSRGERHAILDGNVKRVLSRVFAVARPPKDASAELWELAESLLPPRRDIRPYAQGLMDLGATVCRRAAPLCAQCPLAGRCRAREQNAVERFPVRAKKPPKPEKRAHFLIAIVDGRILLERRPPRGVWGGLWAPPQAASKKALLAEWGVAAAATTARFAHEFTHYRLRATAHICDFPPAAPLPPAARWLRGKDLPRIGLPAPIRKLLAEKRLPSAPTE